MRKSNNSRILQQLDFHTQQILKAGHRVKIHKITPSTGKERGDLEIKDYVVLQKPQEQADCLPPPRTLILDFTLTHPRFGRLHVHPIGHLTNTDVRMVLLNLMVV